ncbi:ribbon-helix-helix domain-containing protein [Natronoarchaeum rubrum]|uniref:ribbon-helix-helix domain-containing protein n=1 Tax=Natronoarchaeum rubrum TaxID=755311 RepID=UPI0021131021|nr:CopG family transcriptional regulator [Natronoarchaeum rubrum]HMB49427.1 CopG family transcriptional regulator [Natronoarchaeum rubrum]
MPNIEVSLPDRVDTEIDRLVDQGEFLNREQAIEELLSMGMSAYETTGTSTEDDEWVMQNVEDQTDPAMQDDVDEDGRMF